MSSRSPTPIAGLSEHALAAAVAHEVRRLLTPARGYAQIALGTPGLGQDACRSLKAVLHATDACEEAMRFLLGLDGSEGSCDAGEVVRSHFNADCQVELELDGDCSIPLSASALELVVSNLVANAKRATTNGSPISLTVRLRSTGNKSQVCVTVQDSGCGMDATGQRSVFTPFVSHSNGTGIGLALCLAIVESANGTISIESKPGRGTKVTMQFPLAESKSQRRAA